MRIESINLNFKCSQTYNCEYVFDKNVVKFFSPHFQSISKHQEIFLNRFYNEVSTSTFLLSSDRKAKIVPLTS